MLLEPERLPLSGGAHCIFRDLISAFAIHTGWRVKVITNGQASIEVLSLVREKSRSVIVNGSS